MSMVYAAIQNRPTNTKRGFTLVELLVSVAVFAVVVVIATTTLLVLVRANAEAQRIETAVSNLSFALDLMTRDIRTGYAYYCDNELGPALADEDGDLTRDCNNSNQFAYVDGRTGERTGYRLFEGSIQIYENSVGTWQDLTSPQVFITDLVFDVSGSTVGDEVQPYAEVLVTGVLESGTQNETTFELQTQVSQRLLDI